MKQKVVWGPLSTNDKKLKSLENLIVFGEWGDKK
jgi:hypothetical protein